MSLSGLIQNPLLTIAPIEDGYLAYDVESGRLHRLNAAAALLLELSDGSRDANTLCSELAALGTPISRDMCRRWVDEALGHGLLRPQDLQTPAPLSADQIHATARELRDHGEVLAAFVCQRHATLQYSCSPGEWVYLGELAHIVGRRDDARDAYARYLELRPEDEEVAHILKALRNEPAPPRAPDRCIEQLYARFAGFYEDSMCGDLEYRAPQRLMDAVNDALGDITNVDALDIGCGTGLFGKQLRARAGHLTGIDLSAEMIDHARNCNVYDALEVAEITSWLAARRGASFDLIAACDCLIYFGDLRQVLVPAARLLKPGGLLAFTVEHGQTEPFTLTDSGRYSHTKLHITEAARDAGLSMVTMSEAVLRYEYGEAVTGIVAVTRR